MERGPRGPKRAPKNRGSSPPHGAEMEGEPFLGANQFSREPVRRFGDLLPLPLPLDDGFQGPLFELNSRRSRQRVQRRRLLHQREVETVMALNSLGGFESGCPLPTSPKNLAQRSVLKRVHEAHMSRAPPVLSESPQAALRQLLKGKAGPGYNEVSEGPGALASYVPDRLSLPRGQNEPVDLLDILPPREKEQLLHFEEHLLLSGEEMAAVQEKGFVNDYYLDPILANNQKKYHQFISALVDCSVVRFTNKPRVQVGAFCVTKKNNKQRLIIDARRANKLFRKPPSTILGSSDSWTRLEVAGGEDVFFAQEDVKDYFYRLRISKRLGEFFSLPQVDCSLLKAELGFLPAEVETLLGEGEGPIYPCLAVLPMGFSWAFHLAHQAHMHLAATTLTHAPFLRDRHPAPVLGRGLETPLSALLIYADNANHIGVERQRVQDDQDRLQQALHIRGLETHDVENCATLAESLGVRIDGLGGLVTPTAKRDWRLDRALQGLRARPVMSGEQLQVVVGHMTIRALLHRGLFSIFRHVYQFIEKCYTVRCRLWKSVAEEVEIFRALMPLGVADFKASWDQTVLCTDACLSGFAVMGRTLDPGAVGAIGRHDERWRFRRQDGAVVAPRERALDSTRVFDDPRTVLPDVDGEVFGDVEMVENFPEVPREILETSCWNLLWNTPMHFKEPVHLIEARSVLGAVKHMARDFSKHGKRILILNDNMGVVLAVQKGRCTSYALLRIVRRMSAHLLAAGIRCSIRWVPSEYNVADLPSRAWENKLHAQIEAQRRRQATLTEAEKKPGGRVESQETRSEDLYTECCERGKFPSQESSSSRTCFSKEKSQSFAREVSDQASPKNRRIEEPSQSQPASKDESKTEADKVFQEAEGEPRGIWHSRNGLGQECNQAGLLAAARPFLRVRGQFQPAHRHRARARPESVRLRRPLVPKRGIMQFGTTFASSPGVCPPRSSQARNPVPAALQEVPQRVAQTCTNPDAAAHDRVHQERHLRRDDSSRVPRNGAVQRSLLFNICPARGTAESISSRCGGKEQGLRSLRDCVGTAGERRSIENRDLRRGLDPGRCQTARFGTLVGSRVQAPHQREGRRSASVEFHRHQILAGLASSSECFGGGRLRHFSLSEPAWGCLTGPLAEVEEHPRHSTEGTVELRSQCQDLRQTGPFATDDEPLQGGFGGFWRRGPPQFHNLVPRWQSSPSPKSEDQTTRNFHGRSFLSLFGGVAEPAKFWVRNGGRACVVDIQDSPQNDLSKHFAWNDIDKNLSHFDVIGIDIACNTWTRARRAPWWSKLPKPLRQPGQYIFGLPKLRPLDAEKVKAANVMFLRAIKVIKKSLKLGLAGYMENPANSLIWQTPQIQRLLRDGRCQLRTVHMCQYNCQWKKPTKLLLWNAPLTMFNLCRSRTGCSRTGRPHLQLTGVVGKRFVTAQAQTYSANFAEALMLVFINTPHTPPSHKHGVGI